MTLQLFETPHQVRPGLYYKQFLTQQGGMPHFAGRIHVRPFRGMGLTGGSFLTKLIPMNLIANKIGKAVMPKVLSAIPSATGRRIVQRVGPKLLKSALYNARDVFTGKKDVKTAMKDTVIRNTDGIIKDTLEAATGQKWRKGPAPPRKRRKPPPKRVPGKRIKMSGKGFMSTSRDKSALARGKKQGITYLYDDVFNRIDK